MLKKEYNIDFMYDLKTFKTFEEAVADSPKRKKFAAQDSEILAQASIKNCFFNLEKLALLFSNGKILEIYLSESRVDWNLVEDLSFKDKKDSMPNSFILVKPPIKKEWQWKKILNILQGKIFKGFSVSATHLFFSVSGMDELYCDGFKILNSDQNILYFSEL